MKKVIAIIAIIFLSIPIAALVNASQVESTQIPALSSQKWVINLNKDDSFSGSLSISGGSGNDIDFSVTDPQGTTIVGLGRVSQGRTFDFTADSSGAYTFHLGNTFSLLSSKTVSMSYDITHPLLGGVNGVSLSQMIPIIAIIFVVLVVVVLAVVLTRKKPSHQATS